MKNSLLVILASLCILPLSAQQRDIRVREYLTPKRIVWMQDSAQIRNAEYLLDEGNGQADLSNARICLIRSTRDKHPALLFDFGKEIQGGLQFVTGMSASHEPVRIRVRLGESASEAM